MVSSWLLLSAAALLLVSPSTASSASGAVQDIIEQLSTGCRAGIDDSAAVEEIRLGQEEISEMVTSIQKQAAQEAEECPSGWTRHRDSCYLIPLSKSSWYEAQHHCAALDRRARLATISPSAGDFTEQLVASTRGSYGAWIGLSRLEQAGEFGWIDGARPVATRWNTGEPSGDGDCVHIWGPEHGAAKGWNDLPCHIASHILCQIKLR
ncbi:CD209 antigen-like protein C [Amphibalanus amphitrite]|uniref:CD209 antigen-like protein C n=1 Tax=Amphibalanus amphitrite TaxID=1232801 RepID=A0A6A4WBZ2_AMPAM|nr:lactose-binding lectin l-2-like [Amphibalanus amphitrite]KAF0299431.1 CD209 antigen-like protein C [Amphibalanus amphitrite]